MEIAEQAEAAFERIINNGRTSEIKKTATACWSAYSENKEITDLIGTNFEKAIQNIPLDYRSPTVPHLEVLNTSKDNGIDVSECYLTLAVNIVDRIVKPT